MVNGRGWERAVIPLFSLSFRSSAFSWRPAFAASQSGRCALNRTHVTRRRLLLCVIALLLAGVVLVFAASRWATASARAATDRTSQALARTHLGLLSSELQKFRLLPLVLADYPDVVRALEPDGGDAARRLDARLELLARRTDAAAIYAIDRDGRAVAASNWRLPTSFVGQNYGFRPYFAQAMKSGAAELFALGTVSGRPGLYLARRVDRDGAPLGVIVLKVEFDRLERNWARAPGMSMVTDRQGVILVTSRPDWRFRATHPLDARTVADARRSLQFGAGPPALAPVVLAGSDASTGTGVTRVRYRVSRLPAPLAEGELVHLTPLEPALVAARTTAALWALGILLVLAIGGGLALRSAETRRLQREARAALEEEVARRTAELRDANARLVVESQERADAELRYRSAREELAQANRLGSLGQIVAGVAHEINQPVAAIRTYADNGEKLIARDQPAAAGENLRLIVGLADRIGAITAELKGFARRKAPAVGTTPLGAVFDGVTLLLGERVQGLLTFAVPKAFRESQVVGDRIRLEQIVLNLIQNAIDALSGNPVGAIRVTAEDGPDGVLLVRVADNGPGVADELRDSLFAPFASAKPDGLGLGLAIARDIARGFGGDLALEPSARGATFRLTLRRA